MIRTKLPFFKERYDEVSKEIITTREDIDVTIDTSIFSQQRWETQFPMLAEKETLLSYLERVKKGNQLDLPKVLSMLKALFCFIKADDFKTFEEFTAMFSMSNSENLQILINKIKDIFEAIAKSSAAKSKN